MKFKQLLLVVLISVLTVFATIFIYSKFFRKNDFVTDILILQNLC